MDTKSNLSNRKKINELAIQHNKLTTLVACLLNEIGGLKKELHDIKGNDSVPTKSMSSSNHETISSHQNNRNTGNMMNNKFPNFNDLRAEDILKQLSINTPDN
jgi:hypothetical protein